MTIRPYVVADADVVVRLSVRAWAPVFASIETGGDPGHAPARRAYEKVGFQVLPIARFFKKL